MIVEPFRGLRPRADLAAKIPSPPYDVLDDAEARAMAEGDPYTFLHVIRAEIDLDPSIDPHDDRVYAKARENFLDMQSSGWLARDPRLAFYLYRLRMGAHEQTGIVGAAAVSDYLDGSIKRHEHTRPEKEDDRVRHTASIEAHPGPVFLAYRDEAAVDRLVREATERAPDVDFLARDGVAHTLWVVDDPLAVDRLRAALALVPATYIADGHHRAAAYARVGVERGVPRFLAAHFPASSLRILDYNRVVRDLGVLSAEDLCARIQRAGFDVADPWPAKRPPRRGSFGMYLDRRWRLVSLPSDVPAASDPVDALDVAILQDRILAPLLGIDDPRSSSRLAFVGGIRGVEELQRRVDAEPRAVAFTLFPTSLVEVMNVADAGGVMPPKSTWFEPKLRSGMVVHPFNGSG